MEKCFQQLFETNKHETFADKKIKKYKWKTKFLFLFVPKWEGTPPPLLHDHIMQTIEKFMYNIINNSCYTKCKKEVKADMRSWPNKNKSDFFSMSSLLIFRWKKRIHLEWIPRKSIYTDAKRFFVSRCFFVMCVCVRVKVFLRIERYPTARNAKVKQAGREL